LYLLWRRRRNEDGSLVSAEVLRQELLQGKAGTKFSDQINVDYVKNALRRLKKEGMVEDDTLPKDNSDPGPAPKGYRFSADAPIVTYRATAFMIMRLHNHSERRVKQEAFAEEILPLGLSHYSQDHALTRSEVVDQIAFCIRKGYFKVIDVISDEFSTPVPEKRLVTTSKVDDYRIFIEKIAADAKMQAATERGPSGSQASEQSGVG